MDAFIDIISKDESANVVRIKLNLKKNERLLEADKLYDYIEEQYDESKDNYLLIDEVQMCDGFERVINSIYEEEIYDIYLTGSNAFLLSSDLATLFGGRVYEISLYPFSFREYLAYYPSNDIDKAFDSFVKDGGMAGSYLYKTEEDARKYVNGIYRTNDKTVGSYINYYCRSFLFYPIQRYDIRGKRYLESNKKYYLSDLSFRFSKIGTKNADYGHLYENIVAIELLRRGYEVYVGKLYKKEVDFVAIKEGEKVYIQVSDDITRR